MCVCISMSDSRQLLETSAEVGGAAGGETKEGSVPADDWPSGMAPE